MGLGRRCEVCSKCLLSHNDGIRGLIKGLFLFHKNGLVRHVCSKVESEVTITIEKLPSCLGNDALDVVFDLSDVEMKSCDILVEEGEIYTSLKRVLAPSTLTKGNYQQSTAKWLVLVLMMRESG